MNVVAPINVTLTTEEIVRATRIGTLRHMEALAMGKVDCYGFDGDPLQIHIDGAIGELAFCKALGVEWTESVNTFKMPDHGDDIQVRTTFVKNGKLIVRPNNNLTQRYVLVTGDLPNLVIQGWKFGLHATLIKWEEDYNGRPPAWFVPRHALNHDFTDFLKKDDNMCAVSVIYDLFRPMPNDWYNQERIDLFRSLIKDAKEFDIQAGQPDCEDPEKAKIEEHINAMEKQIAKEKEYEALEKAKESK